METPERRDFGYCHKLQLRWSDMDALGHVNNARFFTYDECARLAFFTDLMSDDAGLWKDYGLILAHIECDFLAQLKAPGSLEVAYRIDRLGRTSLHTKAAMYQDVQCVATSRTVLVWFDYPHNRPLPLPQALRQRIREVSVRPPVES